MIEYAVIDIGSNSVRYAEERGGRLPDKEVFTTRLGSGLMRTGRLMDETMARSLAVLRMLSLRAREAGLVPRAYATSAVRDAANGPEFSNMVERECGVRVDVLSGEQEARYAFLGAVGDGTAYDAMLDIGGASMQVVTADFGVSFRAGCVRCGDIAREAVGASDCDENRMRQQRAVEEYMDSIWELPELDISRIVGVGGSITTLAALRAGLREFIPEAVEKVILTPDDVDALIERLAAMGGMRREHPLLAERHDVILYGAYILRHAMARLGADSIGISCADGMEGYLKVLKSENQYR